MHFYLQIEIETENFGRNQAGDIHDDVIIWKEKVTHELADCPLMYSSLIFYNQKGHNSK